MVEALVGRVVAGAQPAAGQAAACRWRCRRWRTGRHDEVELLAGQRLAQAGAGERLVGRRRRPGQVGRARCRSGAWRRRRTTAAVAGPAGYERDVRAALAARAVALVPAVVDRDLELVAARRHGELRGCTSCCRPPGSGRWPCTSPASRRRSRARTAASRPPSRCARPRLRGRAAAIGASVPAAATSGARRPGRTRRDRATGAPAVSEQPVGPGPLSIGWGGRRGGRTSRTKSGTATGRTPCELLAEG